MQQNDSLADGHVNLSEPDCHGPAERVCDSHHPWVPGRQSSRRPQQGPDLLLRADRLDGLQGRRAQQTSRRAERAWKESVTTTIV